MDDWTSRDELELVLDENSSLPSSLLRGSQPKGRREEEKCRDTRKARKVERDMASQSYGLTELGTLGHASSCHHF